MPEPSKSELDTFVNALQLCLKSRLKTIGMEDEQPVLWFFDNVTEEKPLQAFEKLVEGEWFINRTKTKDCYLIHDKNQLTDSVLINFLYLTRLKEANMLALAEINPIYKPLIEKIGLKTSKNLNRLEDISEKIFSRIEEQKKTLREMAEATGLTQVSISNFKAGKDIRLSSLLKMTKALQLKIKIE